MALPIEAAPAPAVDDMTDEEFYANISRVFSILLEYRKMEKDELADAMNIGRSTLYGKLASGKFTAREVRVAAKALRVKVDAFYHHADSLMSEAFVRWYSDFPAQNPFSIVKTVGQMEIPFTVPRVFASVGSP